MSHVQRKENFNNYGNKYEADYRKSFSKKRLENYRVLGFDSLITKKPDSSSLIIIIISCYNLLKWYIVPQDFSCDL